MNTAIHEEVHIDDINDLDDIDGSQETVGKETFAPWDVAEYLLDEDDIRGYLDVVASECADDESCLLVAAMRDAMRARSINQLAQATGLDRELVFKCFPANAAHALAPTAEQAHAIAQAFLQMAA